MTNPDGSFTFVNIPSKTLTLVLVVVPNSFVLLNPKDQSSIIITAKPGETIDLGKLDYDHLPIPSK